MEVSFSNEQTSTSIKYRSGCTALKETGATSWSAQQSTSMWRSRIEVDQEFLGHSVMKLKTFYFSALLPELALPQRTTGGIREPSEWLKTMRDGKTESSPCSYITHCKCNFRKILCQTKNKIYGHTVTLT